jgi:hypothetical protein
MNKEKLVYFYDWYIGPIIKILHDAKRFSEARDGLYHFIQARARWRNLRLSPPKDCLDGRLDIDSYMLETLPENQWYEYTKNLQKIRDQTCNLGCRKH